jgi:hypothetical protein
MKTRRRDIDKRLDQASTSNLPSRLLQGSQRQISAGRDLTAPGEAEAIRGDRLDTLSVCLTHSFEPFGGKARKWIGMKRIGLKAG